MCRFKKTALVCAPLFVVLLSLPLANAAAAEKAHKHEHSVSAKALTVESLKGRPKTKLKIAKNETVLHVSDLHCAHCAKSLAGKLYTVKGVVKVRTDVKADVAIITPQSKKKIDALKLWDAAKKSGFPAIKLVGPDGTYVIDPKTKAAQKVVRTKKPSA